VQGQRQSFDPYGLARYNGARLKTLPFQEAFKRRSATRFLFPLTVG